MRSFFFLIIFAALACNGEKEEARDSGVKAIFDQHCVKCHRPQGGAPFSLMSYSDVSKRTKMIKHVINDNYMPPWPADTSFSHFINENYLSLDEKGRITDWINNGAERQEYGSNSDYSSSNEIVLAADDLIYSFEKPFSVPGNNAENYIVYVIPLNNEDTLDVRGVGYIPGESGLTHHVRFMIDTTGLLRPDHGISVGSDSEYGRLKVALADPFFYGWLPGNFMTDFGDDRLKYIPPHSDLILNVHYSPTPIAVEDHPKVVFRRGENTPKTKMVRTLTMDESNISNQPFYLPRDTMITFYSRSVMVPYDIELVSVMPHMHLLGQFAKVFAITPNGDLIPLVHIPEWNFDWQFTYLFEKETILPKGSVIYGEFGYNNTLQNLSNPYNPTKDIKYGWGTNDEMMNIVIDYVIR